MARSPGRRSFVSAAMALRSRRLGELILEDRDGLRDGGESGRLERREGWSSTEEMVVVERPSCSEGGPVVEEVGVVDGGGLVK